jgi:hypothetical protein
MMQITEDDEIDQEMKQLSVELANEDDLGAIVRAHIRIENLLFRYISALTPRSRHLKEARLDYYKKTSLALAMGLREDLKGPLRSLGSVRNDFAHEPNAGLHEKQLTDFVSSFSVYEKNAYEMTIKMVTQDQLDDGFPLTHKDHFRVAVLTLWSACRRQVKAAEEISPFLGSEL